MKKTIITMAIVAAALFSFNSFASSPEKKCCNPFEGISLTTQQKEKLDKIACPAKTAKADKEKKKAEGKQNVEAKQKNRKSVRTKYLKDVQSVLTPQQYVQFLENSYVNGRFAKKDAKKDSKKDGRKSAKKDGKRKDSNMKKSTASKSKQARDQRNGTKTA